MERPTNNDCTVSAEIASDGLKGRVFEVSLADLQDDEVTFRKFRLIAEEVQGRHVLTNFHGMNLTTDKLRSMVKKWQVREFMVCRAVFGISSHCNAKQ